MPDKAIAAQPIEIKTQDGVSDSVFYHPQGEGPWPGVLYFTDIGGIRDANRESAAQLAQQGFAVLMPNIFYRTSRTPLLPSLRSLDEEGRKKRMAELSSPLTPEAMERDSSTYIDALTSQSSTQKGAVGVAGYCFSERWPCSPRLLAPKRLQPSRHSMAADSIPPRPPARTLLCRALRRASTSVTPTKTTV